MDTTIRIVPDQVNGSETSRLFFVFLPLIVKKKLLVILLVSFFCFLATQAMAQCSVFTKTAQQLGEKPARGMNSGIIYLAFAPFAIVGYVGYRWWKNNHSS